jgi:hypothetical protein
MSGPVPIDAARLLDFVDAPGLGVLFVPVHRRHAFNAALVARVREAHDGPVGFATLPLRALLGAATPALRFLHEGLRACGGPTALGVPPGYWLFRTGEVLAWDSGLPIAADAAGIARGALVGAVWSAVTRHAGLWLTALRIAAEDAAARRMAAAFRDAAARRSPDPGAGRDPPEPAVADELRRAYALLGVAPEASIDEVKRAWRALVIENHPDRAANDPAEFERRCRVAAELNRARDVILAHRATAASGARA